MNPGGMCCAMITAAPRSGGSAGITSASGRGQRHDARRRPRGRCGAATGTHRAREHRGRVEVHRERATQRPEQAFAERVGVQALVRRRLADEIDGAEFKSAQRQVVAARFAAGGEHHDRTRHLAHDVAQHLQAVEARHLYVERDEVRVQCVHLPDRVESVLGFANDAEFVARPDQVHEDAPDEFAVVDDQHRPPIRTHDRPPSASVPASRRSSSRRARCGRIPRRHLPRPRGSPASPMPIGWR